MNATRFPPPGFVGRDGGLPNLRGGPQGVDRSGEPGPDHLRAAGSGPGQAGDDARSSRPMSSDASKRI